MSARRSRSILARVTRGFLILLLLAVAAVASAWYAWHLETTGIRLAAGDPPIRLYVPPGANADSIGRDLQIMGLTPHPLVFRMLARSRGVSSQLKAGDYALQGPLSLEDVLHILVRGDVVHRAITVPEGRTIEEIAQLVAAQGLDASAFLEAASDPQPVRDIDPLATDLEGYLFPDTYDISQTPEAPRLLVSRMTDRFKRLVLPQLERVAVRDLTVRQVVTVASIVEMETARPEERPRIAAVFLNRLHKGMLLQTDPTVIFALKKAGRWDGNLRREDLMLDSPYNTYRRAGLPPGPIACPGRESILAVLDPAPTRDLYFVSRNDGTHEFTDNLADHNARSDRYQRRRASS